MDIHNLSSGNRTFAVVTVLCRFIGPVPKQYGPSRGTIQQVEKDTVLFLQLFVGLYNIKVGIAKSIISVGFGWLQYCWQVFAVATNGHVEAAHLSLRILVAPHTRYYYNLNVQRLFVILSSAVQNIVQLAMQKEGRSTRTAW